MHPEKLKHQIDESTVVHTLVDVHKIRKISQQQMSDILSTSPNYLPPVVEKANAFLEKMSHLITMSKLQIECDDPKYAAAHPEEAKAVKKYFKKDALNADQFSYDMVTLGCMFDAIGKFCISTEKFFKEIAVVEGETREELIENILPTIEQEMDEYVQDEPIVSRYALRFFRKLLAKQETCLPDGVTGEEILMYIKGNIYNEDGYKNEN